MNTKYWCFQEISFGVFAPNTSKSNIRVSEPTPTPSTALTLLLLGTGGLLRRLLDFKIPLTVSVKWRPIFTIFSKCLLKYLPPRRLLLVPHHRTSKAVDFPDQTTFVAHVVPLAVHCSSWTSSPPCKHAVTTSIQNTVGQRPDLKDILVQVKRAFFGGWGVLTEETKFEQHQNVAFWIYNFAASLAHLQIQEIIVMSTLTSLSSDDDE